LDFNKRYPGASGEALDLLSRILVFNPYFRLSVDDALDHPFFSDIKNASFEVSAKEEIELTFEKDELTRDHLRELFVQEGV
jgi:serine/threonine protein kinase